MSSFCRSLCHSGHELFYLLLLRIAFTSRETFLTATVLNILYTDPQYHGKGAGKMMVEWGNALANQLMLPCWVEASPAGHRLYSSCGYEDVEQAYRQTESLELPMDYMAMRRPLNVTKMEGRELEKR